MRKLVNNKLMTNKTKKLNIGVLPILIFLLVTGSVQAQTVNELVGRGGLSSFIKKVKTNNHISIAYLGGSITEAQGWREHSFEFFKEKYPNTIFNQINAAIGGTGSEFGAYRLQEHVLVHKPDLVFVEFAVNDNIVAEDKIIQAMEGIVLQIKQNNPETDICFVYTIMEGFLEKEKYGQLPDSKLAMEKVAKHYGIPTINFGYEVSKRVVENSLIFTGKHFYKDSIPVFSADGVHPFFETGHAIYAEIFERSMEKLLSNYLPVADSSAGRLHPSPLILSRCVTPDPKYLEGKWSSFNPKEIEGFEKFSSFLDSIYLPSEESAHLRIEFKGTSIGFVDIIGPEAGALIIEVDGKENSNKVRFDEYGNFRRISYFLIEDLEDKIHQVVIKIDPKKFDKEAILNKRKISVNDPAMYKNQTWHLGKILVNGVLL